MDFNTDNHKTFTLTEAEKYLGVSRATLWRIIRQYKIPTYTDVLDRRVKRVYLTPDNRASKVELGLYADASAKPTTRLGSCVISTPNSSVSGLVGHSFGSSNVSSSSERPHTAQVSRPR